MSTFVNPIALPNLYVNGCNLTYVSATAMTVGVGQIRSSENNTDIEVDSALTLNTAISGAGGLDTGTIAASSCYYVYILVDLTKNTPLKAICSLSSTGPLVPADYTESFVRVGAFYTNSSSQILKAQYEMNSKQRVVEYDAVITELTAGNATSFTAVDLTSSVPATSRLALINVVYTPATAGNSFFLRPTGSTSTNGKPFTSNVASQPITFPIMMNTNSAQSIDYKVTASGDALTIYVLGYIDNI